MIVRIAQSATTAFKQTVTRAILKPSFSLNRTVMKWGTVWPRLILPWILLVSCTPTLAMLSSRSNKWNNETRLAAREKTRDLWYHGFDNYMTYAFPMDELTPLSCSGQGPDWTNPRNIAANDVAGNFSLTLIDVLDSFVVLGDRSGFEEAVKNVISWVSFDVNTKPQVFEVTIRVLGGLLSGHIFATAPDQPFYLPWYKNELLDMAHDLGKRLLPAFNTPTGLPYARINLRHGVMKGESIETCTAGAGSLILEFATLSRLTGDPRFEKVAHKAFFGIWNRRSNLNLVGNTINTFSGAWTTPEVTSIGAGVDSFFEYALKWYVLSGDPEFLDVWDDAYAAMMRYSRAMDGFWFRTVNMNSGDAAYFTIDSLSAFWPGLQVLAGDIQSAIKLHLIYYNLWKEHSGLPEVFDTHYKKATSHQYPLRPEFIESTWYLYRATRDPFYLDVGEQVLSDLISRAKVDCGLTGIQDLRINKQDDRMESFALSETLKYLYLLFDEENPLNSEDSNFVFTTEGHILKLPREHLHKPSASRRKSRPVDNTQCPAYTPTSAGRFLTPSSPAFQGVLSRGDFDYARLLVGRAPHQYDVESWSPYGWCERPQLSLFTYDYILSADGSTVPEDLSPSFLKLEVVSDGYVLHNVTGVRMQTVRRLDGKGYDVRQLGHYTVRPGQVVYINDSTIFMDTDQLRKPTSHFEVPLRFWVDIVDPMLQGLLDSSDDLQTLVHAFTAHFGGDPFMPSLPNGKRLRFANSDGLTVQRETSNPNGCNKYEREYPNSILVARRGECTFLEKLVAARDVGAAGVVVISDEENSINPTAEKDEVEAAGDLSDVVVALLPAKEGAVIETVLDSAEKAGWRVMMKVEADEEDVPQPTPTEKKDPNRILYINGHPLKNTKLLV